MTCNQMKQSVTLIKLQISLGLKIVGNIWDNVSTQLDKSPEFHISACFVFLPYSPGVILYSVLAYGEDYGVDDVCVNNVN